MEPVNFARAYRFGVAMCRGLQPNRFDMLVMRADHHRVWSYVRIEQWVLPFLFLTLENFEAVDRWDRPYGFHFIIRKRGGTTINEVWRAPLACTLVKVFTADGEPVRTRDNPYPITPQALASKVGGVAAIIPPARRA